MTTIIPRDIACLLKEYADPISYGRLVCVSHVFYDSIEPARYRRKLKELLKKLPKGTKPVGRRSGYIFFCKARGRELREELPDLTASQVMAQLGAEWRRMSQEDKEPYQALSLIDKERYDHERQPDVLRQLIQRRDLALRALQRIAKVDATALLECAEQIYKKQKIVARRVRYDTWSSEMRNGTHPRKAAKKASNAERASKKLKRGMSSGWQCYMKRHRAEVVEEMMSQLHDARGIAKIRVQQQVMGKLSERWRQLTPEQKQAYENEAQADRIEKAKIALHINDN